MIRKVLGAENESGRATSRLQKPGRPLNLSGVRGEVSYSPKPRATRTGELEGQGKRRAARAQAQRSECLDDQGVGDHGKRYRSV